MWTRRPLTSSTQRERMPAGSTLWSSGSIALSRRGGLLLDGGDTVGQGGAAQIARIFLVLVASRPVHGRAVVPHDQVADPPCVRIHELTLGRMLGQFAKQKHRFRHRPADDAAGM